MRQASTDHILQSSPNTSVINFKQKNNGHYIKLQSNASQHKYHLSIETKPSGSKLIPKSNHLSKTTKNEENDDSYALGVQKSIEMKNETLPRTWGSPIVKRHLRKITTPQQTPGEHFISPISKTNVLSGFESPPFSSFHHESATLDQPYSSLSITSKRSIQVVLNERYMKSNPHFSKFNRSIYAVDKRDNDKLSLSKESFYYPEQVEAIDNIKRYKSKEQEVNLSLLTKSKFMSL